VVAAGVIDTDPTSIVVTTSRATTHAATAAVDIQRAMRRARGISKRSSSRFPTLLKRRGRALIKSRRDVRGHAEEISVASSLLR
jgi:hypothetical protein